MAPEKTTDSTNVEKALTTGSWILLAILSAAGLLRSSGTAAGIIIGGILAIGNLYWIKSVLHRALSMPAGKVQRFAFIRHLLRLGILGLILYVLIVRFGVDVLGLIIGLSVLVLNMMTLTLYLLIRKGG